MVRHQTVPYYIFNVPSQFKFIEVNIAGTVVHIKSSVNTKYVGIHSNLKWAILFNTPSLIIFYSHHAY